MTHKNRKKSRILMFLSTVCSLLRAEGFSCSLGVHYGGVGINYSCTGRSHGAAQSGFAGGLSITRGILGGRAQKSRDF